MMIMKVMMIMTIMTMIILKKKKTENQKKKKKNINNKRRRKIGIIDYINNCIFKIKLVNNNELSHMYLKFFLKKYKKCKDKS